MGDRGIIDYPQTTMEPCFCGAPITNLSLHYGPTPYGIYCDACKTTYLNKITNCDVDGAVKVWNKFRNGGENRFEIKAFQVPLGVEEK